MTLTERQAEVLSYLTGLAPVGNEIQVPDKYLSEDMPHMNRCYFRALIRDLEAKGAIERVARGRAPTAAVMRVLRRPEAFVVRDLVGYAGREAA